MGLLLLLLLQQQLLELLHLAARTVLSRRATAGLGVAVVAPADAPAGTSRSSTAAATCPGLPGRIPRAARPSPGRWPLRPTAAAATTAAALLLLLVARWHHGQELGHVIRTEETIGPGMEVAPGLASTLQSTKQRGMSTAGIGTRAAVGRQPQRRQQLEEAAAKASSDHQQQLEARGQELEARRMQR